MSKVTALLDVNPFFKSLAEKTKEIDEKLVKEIRTTGAMVESDYKKATPVDTGRLRSSAHMQHSDNRTHRYSDKKGGSFDGTLSTDPDRYTVFVGTNVEYAPMIERGFSGSVSIKSHMRTNKRGTTFAVRSHSRRVERKGNHALETAFEKNVSGLMQRLAKLIQ